MVDKLSALDKLSMTIHSDNFISFLLCIFIFRQLYPKQINGVAPSCLHCIDALLVVWISQGYDMWVNVSLPGCTLLTL